MTGLKNRRRLPMPRVIDRPSAKDHLPAMPSLRKLSLTGLIAGVVATAAGFGVFAAYSATTSNTGNSFGSGSVAIGDNDGGSAALYSGSNKKPGDSVTSCIQVTYTGTLAAGVRLYTPSTITDGSAFNLTVERGTQSTGAFPGCGDFSPGSVAYDGPLGSFPTTYATGIPGKAAAAAWAQNDSVAYRFTITVNDDPTPNAHTSTTFTGAHEFTWEARNN